MARPKLTMISPLDFQIDQPITFTIEGENLDAVNSIHVSSTLPVDSRGRNVVQWASIHIQNNMDGKIRCTATPHRVQQVMAGCEGVPVVAALPGDVIVVADGGGGSATLGTNATYNG